MISWLLAGLALAPMDHAQLELSDGRQVEGPISAIRGELVVVHVGNGEQISVLLDQVVGVRIEGMEVSLADFHKDVGGYVHNRYGPPDQRRPAPWVVVLASAAVPGGGQALLGDWNGFAAYLVADLAALSVGGLFLARGQPAAAVPCFALDLTFRFYSAGEARAEARLRQRHNP